MLLTWELSSKTGFNDVSKVAVLVDPGRNARKEQVSEMSPPKIQGKEVLHRFKRFISHFLQDLLDVHLNRLRYRISIVLHASPEIDALHHK